MSLPVHTYIYMPNTIYYYFQQSVFCFFYTMFFFFIQPSFLKIWAWFTVFVFNTSFVFQAWLNILFLLIMPPQKKFHRTLK